jgi:hypothetical protein
MAILLKNETHIQLLQYIDMHKNISNKKVFQLN